MALKEPVRELPWHKILALIPLWLLMVPLMAVLFLIFVPPVALFFFLQSLTGELLFYLRMRNVGRTLSGHRLRQQLAAGETGTLIIEHPLLAWGRTNAWWTPDNILEEAPGPIPDFASEEYQDQLLDLMEQDLPHPWDEWCWQQYTSPHQGQAKLLRVWNGKKYRLWFNTHYPAIRIVETTTAIARQLESEAQPNSIK
ncbi:hypothetical protein FYZ48_12270 [Gimesia chilikensis]|uniref:hypothetical protein n=1 Tax=Gimesia chilikensis TaxID=2605989 RepID=UPI0011F037D5|nr:hypothetical protein [Gimesia chilikensis]KAA0138263.1 hypothetical protein FYZ48_12270 [Gimesia chilikensis]